MGDDDYIEDLDAESEYETNDALDSTGEAVEGREKVMKELYNTEERINLLRHNWRGDVLVPRKINGKTRQVWIKDNSREIAPDSFINTQMSAIRSVCNPTNAVTKKSADEVKRILHDAVDAFIRDLVNEEEINRKHYRTMSKQFEHTLELFLGLPEAGHGAKVLNDALAGLNTQPVKEEKKRGLFG